jgi:phosphatidylserine/phosphatidylglycerophosphate/cardiolipin synthase-like enzyme
MKHKKIILLGTIILIIILITISIVLTTPKQITQINKTINKTIKNLTKENGTIKLCFTQHNNCEKFFINTINSSNELICAFYDVNQKVYKILKKKPGLMIFDKGLKDELNTKYSISQIDFISTSALMHHKFCIINQTHLLTGSMNPTDLGMKNNNNNVLLIKSKTLVNNYLNEIDYLINQNNNNYKKTINFNNFIIENYFCPRDCETIAKQRIINLINKANKTIYVSAFSFTSEQLLESLIDARQRKVTIKLILEKRLINTKGSKFSILKDLGINIIFDNNPNSMHHKFIIIDGEVVQLGSMNYSNNGFSNNNENILIIYNKKIAKEFTKEFNRIWNS